MLVKIIGRSWLLAVLLAACVTATRAQIGSPNPQQVPDWVVTAGGTQQFDAVSVRPSVAGTQYETNIPLDGLDGPVSGNLFVANAPVMAYLLFAYKINDSTQARALYGDLPLWARTQFYKVQARAEGSPTRDQIRLMVQALLADRFKLTIRWDVKRAEEYVLRLVKQSVIGPQIGLHSDATPCDGSTDSSTPLDSGDVVTHCGVNAWSASGQEFVRMTSVSMAQVASYLAGTGAAKAGGEYRPMSGSDATGLIGRFDLELHFSSEVRSGSESAHPSGPLFDEALRKQLGLKLDRETGSVLIPVLIHIEAPSSNQ
ncbi:MAG: TIGR03435 family protein [Acidobacteriaceae bacterium]